MRILISFLAATCALFLAACSSDCPMPGSGGADVGSSVTSGAGGAGGEGGSMMCTPATPYAGQGEPCNTVDDCAQNANPCGVVYCNHNLTPPSCIEGYPGEGYSCGRGAWCWSLGGEQYVCCDEAPNCIQPSESCFVTPCPSSHPNCSDAGCCK